MADPSTSTSTSTDSTTSNKVITTAAELAQLRNEGKTLSTQELKELNARVKALEEMARIEDRLRVLENRKRSRTDETIDDQSTNAPVEPSEAIARPSRGSTRDPPSSRGHHPSTNQLAEPNSSDSSSSSTYHRHKQPCYTKGIKVTPSYTLKVTSSLRE